MPAFSLDARLRARLEERVSRFKELDAKLADPAVISSDGYADVLRERGALAKAAAPYLKFVVLEKEWQENTAAAEDPELAELAKEELARIEAELASIGEGIVEANSPARKDDDKNVMLEIRAGTGGEEAALFAGDLLRMYQRLADLRGWKTELVSSSPSEKGGMKEVILSIEGERVYRDLKHEGGGHRVQRVPETEAQGRIHTSAATVAVLPEVEDFEVELDPEELEIIICRSQGPGGQHVNKTESAVRMTHLPTGITVHMQDEKSQHKNKAKAMRIMRSRVYEFYRAKAHEERASARRSQTGSGDRSERIRTYNFPQNRCTDHRANKNYPLDRIMEGEISNMIDDLVAWGREQELEEM